MDRKQDDRSTQLTRMFEDNSHGMSDGEALLSSLAGATAAELALFLKHPNIHVRVNLARDPRLTAEQITIMAEDADLKVRHAISTRGDIPLTAQLKLVSDNPTIREGLANNPACAVRTLELIATGAELSSTGTALKCHVAGHPSCPLYLQIQLACSGDRQILNTLARREDLSIKLCESLIEQSMNENSVKYPLVMLAMAQNESTPHVVLSKLAASCPSIPVLIAIAVHSNTPPSLLSELTRISLEMESADLGTTLARNTKMPAERIADLWDRFNDYQEMNVDGSTSYSLCDALLENSSTPRPLLSQLQASYWKGTVHCRTVLAGTENTPLATLVAIAHGDIAEQPSTAARKTLDNLDDYTIRAQIESDSCGLHHTIQVGSHKQELGDCLLAMGMTCLYQRIQSMEMTHLLANHQLTESAQQAAPTSLTKRRM